MRTRIAGLLGGLLGAAAVSCVLAGPSLGAAFDYKLVSLPKYGGEPTLAISPQGVMYDTTPSGGTVLFRSNNGGKNWVQTKTADKASGDDSVSTDQSGAVYESNLAESHTLPLEADSWKSLDEGQTWIYGNNAINTSTAGACSTVCQPFGVDREWEDAYIPKGKTTKSALVALGYHDFYGVSSIWVNISTDGGRNFGNPINVFAHGNPNEGALWAFANSFCNTVPIAVNIAKGGPHAGRIYVSWLAADFLQSAPTGCNYSMLQSFHNLFVAWSDDHGSTWNLQLAYDAGIGHDASSPFAAMTLDNKGNPYLAFTTPGPNDNAAVCAAESNAGTVQSDPTCAYHMWVVWSNNGGQTWDGGGGVLTGTAAKAYEVDAGSKTVTDLYPAIAAGNPGKVDVGWLQTSEIEPTHPNGKFQPGACAGPGPSNGNPTYYPRICSWNLYGGQSLDLAAGTSKATWKIKRLTPIPMHVGDICNLGIACVYPTSNRHLLDFIYAAVDPTTGCGHIAYADDNKVNKLRVANQIGGPAIEHRATCVPRTRALAVRRHHGKKHHHHKHKHHHHRISHKQKHRNPTFTG